MNDVQDDILVSKFMPAAAWLPRVAANVRTDRNACVPLESLNAAIRMAQRMHGEGTTFAQTKLLNWDLEGNNCKSVRFGRIHRASMEPGTELWQVNC